MNFSVTRRRQHIDRNGSLRLAPQWEGRCREIAGIAGAGLRIYSGGSHVGETGRSTDQVRTSPPARPAATTGIEQAAETLTTLRTGPVATSRTHVFARMRARPGATGLEPPGDLRWIGTRIAPGHGIGVQKCPFNLRPSVGAGVRRRLAPIAPIVDRRGGA